MDILALILAGSNVVVALVLMGLSVPLWKGTVKRNRTYGFRFPEALESDDAWLAINRYGAQRLVFWSVPLFLLGVATPFFPPGNNLPAILAIANAPLIVFVPYLETRAFARRYRSEA